MGANVVGTWLKSFRPYTGNARPAASSAKISNSDRSLKGPAFREDGRSAPSATGLVMVIPSVTIAGGADAVPFCLARGSPEAVARASAGRGRGGVFSVSTDCAGHSSSLQAGAVPETSGTDCARAELAVDNTIQSEIARSRLLRFRYVMRGKNSSKEFMPD